MAKEKIFTVDDYISIEEALTAPTTITSGYTYIKEYLRGQHI